MKKFVIIFLYVLTTSFLFSYCTEPENKMVKLEPTQKQRITLGEVREIIHLETLEESSLGMIYKAVLDNKNDRIFVHSNFNIYIFNSKGSFLTKLSKGRGPGEISMIISFSVNPKNKRFYALDNSNFLCVFDYDGKMIVRYELKDFSSIDIQCIDDKNIFLHSNYVGGTETNFIGIYNFEEQKIIQKFISSGESPYSKFVHVMGNNFTKCGERQFFSGSNIFGLFEFKNNNFHKVIGFDLAERVVPMRFLSQFNKPGGRSIFREEAIRNNYVPFILSAFCFNKYFVVILDDLDYSCYTIEERNNRKVYLNGQISEYFNLPKLRSLRWPCGISEDFLVFSFSPLDFFESDTKEESKSVKIGDFNVNVKYDSNPFLLIVK